MTTIVLKDRNDEDVIFKFTGVTNNGVVYDAIGATLLDRKRLTLQVQEGANVNRVKYKISVPSVCSSGTDCVPTVSYTLVDSGDLSVVRFSSIEDRQDLAAFHKSLAASDVVTDMIVSGGLPS